jgi:hypothetical protein
VTRPLGRSDPNRVSEKEFARIFHDLLNTFGWAHNHVFPLQTSNGWRTGYTAVGWPDDVALRGEYILAVELKGFAARGDRGRLGPRQIEWLDRFARLPTGRAWVLDPIDPPFDALVGWVRYPGSAPRTFGYPSALAPTVVESPPQTKGAQCPTVNPSA